MAYISEQSKRRNEFFDDLLTFIAQQLVINGMQADNAAVAAEEIALCLHEKWGSATLVFPKRPRLYIERTKNAILSEFKGNNILELVRKYRISEATFYRWLREQRAEIKKQAQEKQGQLDL